MTTLEAKTTLITDQRPLHSQPVPRGNALYARLAALMAPSVTIEAAIGEMKEMSKQVR